MGMSPGRGFSMGSLKCVARGGRLINAVNIISISGCSCVRGCNRGLCGLATKNGVVTSSTRVRRKTLRASGIGIIGRVIGVVAVRHTCRTKRGIVASVSRALSGTIGGMKEMWKSVPCSRNALRDHGECTY